MLEKDDPICIATRRIADDEPLTKVHCTPYNFWNLLCIVLDTQGKLIRNEEPNFCVQNKTADTKKLKLW